MFRQSDFYSGGYSALGDVDYDIVEATLGLNPESHCFLHGLVKIADAPHLDSMTHEIALFWREGHFRP